MSNVQSESQDKFAIGIPCKYSETAIIPKFIWDYVEDEVISICRGGEKVLLEIESTLDDDQFDNECKTMFNISGNEYARIWGKRLLHEVEGGWCKVKMNKVNEGD